MFSKINIIAFYIIALTSCSKAKYVDDEVSLIFAAKSTTLSLTDKKQIIIDIIKKNNEALLEEGKAMSILISNIDNRKVTYGFISDLINAIWPRRSQRRSVEALRIFLFRNKP